MQERLGHRWLSLVGSGSLNSISHPDPRGKLPKNISAAGKSTP
jgi:hypothetical protein